VYRQSVMQPTTIGLADFQTLADCYRAFLDVVHGEDRAYPPAALEKEMVEEFVRKRQVRSLARLFAERLSSMPVDDPLAREFLARLTPDQAALVRRLTAPTKSAITRILSRGRIRDEGEHQQLRAYLDSIETDAARRDEVARIRRILDAFG
jgi:hypothetical protein